MDPQDNRTIPLSERIRLALAQGQRDNALVAADRRQGTMDALAKPYGDQPSVNPMGYGALQYYPVAPAALGRIAGNDGAVPGPYAPYGGPYGDTLGISGAATGAPTYSLPAAPGAEPPSNEPPTYDFSMPSDPNGPGALVGSDNGRPVYLPNVQDVNHAGEGQSNNSGAFEGMY